jgi:hypothetical protein
VMPTDEGWRFRTSEANKIHSIKFEAFIGSEDFTSCMGVN